MQNALKKQSTFVETNLFITKKDFFSIHSKFNCAGQLRVNNVDTTLNNFKQRLERIGSPWGWDRRPKYQDEQSIAKRISDPRSHIYSLLLGDNEIGYSLTIARDDLSSAFGSNVAEIENFGINIEHNGEGYGTPFFKHVCNELFKQGFEGIFLSTRSTNHEGVLPFYKRLGMKVINQETKKADLIYTNL